MADLTDAQKGAYNSMQKRMREIREDPEAYEEYKQKIKRTRREKFDYIEDLTKSIPAVAFYMSNHPSPDVSVRGQPGSLEWAKHVAHIISEVRYYELKGQWSIRGKKSDQQERLDLTGLKQGWQTKMPLIAVYQFCRDEIAQVPELVPIVTSGLNKKICSMVKKMFEVRSNDDSGNDDDE